MPPCSSTGFRALHGAARAEYFVVFACAAEQFYVLPHTPLCRARQNASSLSPVLPRSILNCYKGADNSAVGVIPSAAVVEVGRRRIVVGASRSSDRREVR